MGKSSGSSQPSAPNYEALIPLQRDANLAVFREMLNASRVNQSGPQGGSSWSQSPEGTWTQTTSLSPEQERLYQANTQSQLQQAGLLQGLGGQVANATSQPLDVSNLPAAYGQGAADAYYNNATRYLQPEWDRQRSQMEARLGEQGFVPGTPAYSTAMNDLNQTQDRARASAADQAVITGTQLGGQARSQALSELLTRRQLPLNEMNAVRSGTQMSVPSFQGQFGAPNLPGTDIMGSAQDNFLNQLALYNADMAGSRSRNTGIGSLLGMGAGAYFGGSNGAGLGGMLGGMLGGLF